MLFHDASASVPAGSAGTEDHRTSPTPDGFLASLFDTSFRSFITPSIVRVVYLLFMLLDAAAALLFLFASDAWSPMIRLIVAGVGFFVALVWYRMALEVTMVFFRIESNTRELLRRGQ